MIDTTKIEVALLYQAGDPPFVCGVSGMIDLDSLKRIQDDAVEDFLEFEDDSEDGTYFFDVEWMPAQVGQDGRIEIPGYWSLTLTEFKNTLEE